MSGCSSVIAAPLASRSTLPRRAAKAGRPGSYGSVTTAPARSAIRRTIVSCACARSSNPCTCSRVPSQAATSCASSVHASIRRRGASHAAARRAVPTTPRRGGRGRWRPRRCPPPRRTRPGRRARSRAGRTGARARRGSGRPPPTRRWWRARAPATSRASSSRRRAGGSAARSAPASRTTRSNTPSNVTTRPPSSAPRSSSSRSARHSAGSGRHDQQGGRAASRLARWRRYSSATLPAFAGPTISSRATRRDTSARRAPPPRVAHVRTGGRRAGPAAMSGRYRVGKRTAASAPLAAVARSRAALERSPGLGVERHAAGAGAARGRRRHTTARPAATATPTSPRERHQPREQAGAGASAWSPGSAGRTGRRARPRPAASSSPAARFSSMNSRIGFAASECDSSRRVPQTGHITSSRSVHRELRRRRASRPARRPASSSATRAASAPHDAFAFAIAARRPSASIGPDGTSTARPFASSTNVSGKPVTPNRSVDAAVGVVRQRVAEAEALRRTLRASTDHVVRVDADEHDPVPLLLGGELREQRRLFLARAAPGRPEVQRPRPCRGSRRAATRPASVSAGRSSAGACGSFAAVDVLHERILRRASARPPPPAPPRGRSGRDAEGLEQPLQRVLEDPDGRAELHALEQPLGVGDCMRMQPCEAE